MTIPAESINFSIEQLEELAVKLRQHLGVTESNFIDVTELAEEMGFDVFEADFEDDDMQGTFKNSETEKALYVDEDLDERDKRFVIATQIAHIILKHGDGYGQDEFLVDYRNTFRGCITATNFGEKIQAYILAAALLMPKELTIDTWNKSKSVEIVAETFKVSRRVAYLRLDNLGLL